MLATRTTGCFIGFYYLTTYYNINNFNCLPFIDSRGQYSAISHDCRHHRRCIATCVGQFDFIFISVHEVRIEIKNCETSKPNK